MRGLILIYKILFETYHVHVVVIFLIGWFFLIGGFFLGRLHRGFLIAYLFSTWDLMSGKIIPIGLFWKLRKGECGGTCPWPGSTSARAPYHCCRVLVFIGQLISVLGCLLTFWVPGACGKIKLLALA